MKFVKIKNLVIAGILVVMAVRTGQNVVRLWKTGERVNEAENSLKQAQEENSRLKARLEEVKSDEFVEKEARGKLGYGREGETILLLPKQEEYTNNQISKVNESKPNWRVWWDLYVGI